MMSEDERFRSKPLLLVFIASVLPVAERALGSEAPSTLERSCPPAAEGARSEADGRAQCPYT